MEVEIDLQKSVENNAAVYYELTKKAKKKLAGARQALIESKKKLSELQKHEEKFWEEAAAKQKKVERKKEWYEKFHWFISSEDFLCIGGKDATSNEIIIKKHLEKDDLVFHTEAPGSPFFLIKNGITCGEKTILETAQAVGIYSKSWKYGHTSSDVFWVKPEQVSKEAQSGEFISKGSFMVYGKKNQLSVKMECGIGLVESQILGGPLEAIKHKTKNFVVIVPGREKKSSLAKKIHFKLKGGDLDEIIKFLPGEGELKK